jgi:hypothetical protein
MPQMRVSATKYACCCRTVGHRHRPSLGPNALAYQLPRKGRSGSRLQIGLVRANGDREVMR